MRSFRALLIATAVAALPPAAAANIGGITQRSGKQNETCNECHAGGVAPAVRFVGPSELAAGATATFRFEVESNLPPQGAAGFNVAVADGALGTIPGQGARLAADGELTHTEPKPNEEGLAAWSFTWTAPNALRRYRFFGAGNSVNENEQPSGDRARTTRFDVEVVIAVGSSTPSASPTATPPPPTTTATPTDSSTPPSTPTPTPSPSETAPEPTAIATPSQTATPSPTESPMLCAGDCDGNGRVAVSELVTGVNIALGTAAIEVCSAMDLDDSGSVGVSELIAAVNRALRGCI